MALDDKHPEYSERIGEWVQMADTYAGERHVKAKRTAYLPPTETMVEDGLTSPQAPGWKDYNAYLTRAVFPDSVKEAVTAMVGIMHMRPAVITLPPRMEPLLKNATVQGESLHMLLRRINEMQLVKGRLGLLVEVPTGVDVDKTMPYLAVYDAERITNWDAGRREEGKNELELVVLDESGNQREGFTWKTRRKYRVLTRGLPPAGTGSEDWRPAPEASYQVATKVDDTSTPVEADFITPSIGGRDLKTIPFVFIGCNDLVPEPEVPPLLGLSNLALAIYRGEADYRQTLFYQGQQTLVIIGANVADSDEKVRTGNKGVIDVKVGGDAKYIGVSASGLSEMRLSLDADKQKAEKFGEAFLDATSASGASGEALRIRVAARTTTVSSVAFTGGAGLEQALKYAAMWMGENPDDVKVEPATDFADQGVQGAALLAFMQAKQLGLPLSNKSIHRSMRDNDLTEMTFDEEMAQIQEETLEQVEASGEVNDAIAEVTGVDPNAPPADPNAAPAVAVGGSQPTDVPVTPHARKSPTPQKAKAGKKGASAQ